MSYTYASQWGPFPWTDATGRPLPLASVTVYLNDGVTVATLYTSRDKTTTLANPLPTGVTTGSPGIDSYGDIIFFADAGRYKMAANGLTKPITIGGDYELPAPQGTYVRWEDVTKHGAVGDGVADDTAAIQAAINALTANVGGIVWFPPGNYKITSGFTWDDKPVLILGAGRAVQPGAGTRITAAAGVTAFNPKNGAGGKGAHSGIKGIHLVGSDSALGTNDGIRLQCSGGFVEDVTVEGFGRHGVYVLSSTGAADVSISSNGWVLNRVRAYLNKGDGFKTLGTDSNAGTATAIDTDTNGGWGIYEDASLGNHWFGVHLAGNTSGGIRIGASGKNNRMYAVYWESENKPALQMDAGGGGRNVVDFSNCSRPDGASPIVDNTGGRNFVMLDQGGLHWERLFIGRHVDSGGYLDLTYSTAKVMRGAQVQFQNAAETANWFADVNVDNEFYLRSAQGRAVTLDNPVKAQRATTAGRPSATTVGEGSMIYDTTLDKPIWSDGTNWRDAAGTVV